MGKSFFSKMASVKVFDSSVYFAPGKYIVELGEIKMVEGSEKDFLIIETTIEATKLVEDESLKPGATPAHVFAVPGMHDMGTANWKQFLCAILDKESGELTDAEWEKVSEQVLAGGLKKTQAELHCHTILTKNGKEFTKHVWKGVPSPETLKSYGL